jgi:hypothetical protein
MPIAAWSISKRRRITCGGEAVTNTCFAGSRSFYRCLIEANPRIADDIRSRTADQRLDRVGVCQSSGCTCAWISCATRKPSDGLKTGGTKHQGPPACATLRLQPRREIDKTLGNSRWKNVEQRAHGQTMRSYCR